MRGHLTALQIGSKDDRDPTREGMQPVTVTSMNLRERLDDRGRAPVPERLPVGLGDIVVPDRGGGRRRRPRREHLGPVLHDSRGASRTAPTATSPATTTTAIAEDIALMRRLNLNAYRFSIAWPRIIPNGTGQVNHAGLDFYDRLVDALLAAGIQPFPTLYHWDLPQALEDKGGWPVRATAEAFADYAEVVARRLGDRVSDWMTLNEPFVVGQPRLPHRRARARATIARRRAGHKPPPARRPRHGDGANPRRVARRHGSGSCLNFTPVTPIGIIAGCARPAAHRQRPREPLVRRPRSAGSATRSTRVDGSAWAQHEVRDGDMELIARPIDMLGDQLLHPPDGRRRSTASGDDRGPSDAMGWEVHPSALGDLLRGLHERAPLPPVPHHRERRGNARQRRASTAGSSTTTGSSTSPATSAQVHQAMEDGVPVEGYFAWSLLDNFEWAHGYGPKFGLVAVDMETQHRTPSRARCGTPRSPEPARSNQPA